MRRTTVRSLVLIAVLGATLAAAGWLHAQVPLPRPLSPDAQTILSGNDVGFRVEGHSGNTPFGRLVVRVNGQWVDVDFAAGIKRLTNK